jgi:hypothetical protein
MGARAREAPVRKALLLSGALLLVASPSYAVDIVSDPLVENATLASLVKEIIEAAGEAR